MPKVQKLAPIVGKDVMKEMRGLVGTKQEIQREHGRRSRQKVSDGLIQHLYQLTIYYIVGSNPKGVVRQAWLQDSSYSSCTDFNPVSGFRRYECHASPAVPTSYPFRLGIILYAHLARPPGPDKYVTSIDGYHYFGQRGIVPVVQNK
jgi:hypothetical protein